MNRLLIALSDFARVIGHCQDRLPAEACGLLLGRGCRVERVRPLINAHPDPRRYWADADDQVLAFVDMERDGLSLLAIYHSHPWGGAEPSPEDLAQAYYPDSLYLIIAGPPWPARPGDPGAALWDLSGGRATPATLELRGN